MDFYCKKLNLVIEIDGDSHFYAKYLLEDHKRQNLLEELGLSFLRFPDIDIKKSIRSVLQEIENFIDDWEGKNEVSRTSIKKSPLPPLQRGSRLIMNFRPPSRRFNRLKNPIGALTILLTQFPLLKGVRGI